MNVMPLVRTVLPELENEITEIHGDNKVRVINERLNWLHKAYNNVLDGVKIDFSDPVTRFAYILIYTSSHANMVFQCIQDSQALKDIFNKPVASVSCIGEGPGSDILGILKFINSGFPLAQVKNLCCYLCDREETWRESWGDIGNKVNIPSFMLSVVPWVFDVLDEMRLAKYNKIFDADLFTMIYFFSEIYTNREDARSFFEYWLSRAKSGALFLFVDNSLPELYHWLDELALQNGLTIVEGEDKWFFQITSEEEKKDLGPYYDKYPHIKLTAKVFYRVYRKAESTQDLDW